MDVIFIVGQSSHLLADAAGWLVLPFRFRCPGGRSGIRREIGVVYPLPVALFQCPGGRSGIRSVCSVLGVGRARPFQCPGGRSGIRRHSEDLARIGQTLGFNALAGVRGFGVTGPSTLMPYFVSNVSMPWRAFGDSEVVTRQRACPLILKFQCPGGRSGIRSGDPSLAEYKGGQVSMPWRAFGDSEPMRGSSTPCLAQQRFQCPGGRSGIRR